MHDTSHTYETQSRKEDFKAFARFARRRTGPMWPESHVVSYQEKNRERKRKRKEKKEKEKYSIQLSKKEIIQKKN